MAKAAAKAKKASPTRVATVPDGLETATLMKQVIAVACRLCGLMEKVGGVAAAEVASVVVLAAEAESVLVVVEVVGSQEVAEVLKRPQAEVEGAIWERELVVSTSSGTGQGFVALAA